MTPRQTPAITRAFSGTPDLACGDVTLPWDVPPKTIIVEVVDGRWRVVPHGQPVRTFATRDAALAYASRVAGRFDPVWRIVERERPRKRDSA